MINYLFFSYLINTFISSIGIEIKRDRDTPVHIEEEEKSVASRNKGIYKFY